MEVLVAVGGKGVTAAFVELTDVCLEFDTFGRRSGGGGLPMHEVEIVGPQSASLCPAHDIDQTGEKGVGVQA